jgi:hypothetical protein
MQVHLEAPDMNINTTTGDLTDANFTTSSCEYQPQGRSLLTPPLLPKVSVDVVALSHCGCG